MKRLRIVILLLILAAGAVQAKAQTIENFNIRLAQADTLGARVTVREVGNAASMVSSVYHGDPERKIDGYRVRIFFDNSPNARDAGNAILAQFKEMYPDIPAEISYENPYFEVTVGNCISWEEALILWGRIKNTFDKAFVTREKIPLSSFAK